MDKLTFSTLQLICESETNAIRFIEATKDLLLKIPQEFKYTDNGTFYTVFTELTDNYFWLVAESGRPEPHREKWVDIETHQEEENKRKTTQVELTNQSFLYYSFDSKLLYLSNSRHIKLFSKMISEKSENKFFVKRLFVNFDEFIAIIKGVTKIKFTGFNNLFNADSKQFKALEDLTGISAPESFSLEATYNKNHILEFLRFLNLSRVDQKIDTLVICGIDESGFEATYNVESFTKQISIGSNKNTEGVYEHESIKKELINKTNN